MKFNSTKNKLKQMWDETEKIFYEFQKKDKSYKTLKSNHEGLKTSIFLYDSEWVTAKESDIVGG